MTDRYEDGMRALRELPAPDQWPEIERRARALEGEGADPVRSLDAARDRRRRRWPVLVAVAATVGVLALGSVALLRDTAPEVTTSEPLAGPDREPAAPAQADRCTGVRLASREAPPDLDSVQQWPVPDDPRLSEVAQEHLVGTFSSAANTQRAVFVIAARGLGEENGAHVEHPEFGNIWLGWVGDQGLAEPTIPVEGGSCEMTLWSTGLTRQEFRRFLQGLRVAG